MRKDVEKVLNAAKLAGRKTDTGYEFNTNEQATLKALNALSDDNYAIVKVHEDMEVKNGARLVLWSHHFEKGKYVCDLYAIEDDE